MPRSPVAGVADLSAEEGLEVYDIIPTPAAARRTEGLAAAGNTGFAVRPDRRS